MKLISKVLLSLVLTNVTMTFAQADSALSSQSTEKAVIANEDSVSQSSDVPVVMTATTADSADTLSASEKKVLYEKYSLMEKKGRHMRVGGALLISSCAIWIVGGAAIAASAEDNTTTSYEDGHYTIKNSVNGQQVAGMSIGVGGGVLSIIGGITMVVFGRIKQEKGHNQKKLYAVSFNPEYNGLSMNIEF
jgi:hypothetical protein